MSHSIDLVRVVRFLQENSYLTSKMVYLKESLDDRSLTHAGTLLGISSCYAELLTKITEASSSYAYTQANEFCINNFMSEAEEFNYQVGEILDNISRSEFRLKHSFNDLSLSRLQKSIDENSELFKELSEILAKEKRSNLEKQGLLINTDNGPPSKKKKGLLVGICEETKDNVAAFYSFILDLSVTMRFDDFAYNIKTMKRFREKAENTPLIKNFMGDIKDDSIKEAAYSMARTLGGKSLLIVMATSVGASVFSRAISKVVDKGFLGEMNSVVSSLLNVSESSFLSNSILITSMTATGFLAMSCYKAYKRTAAANFSFLRESYQRRLKENSTFSDKIILKIEGILRSHFNEEKEISIDVINDIDEKIKSLKSPFFFNTWIKRENNDAYKYILKSAKTLERNYNIDRNISFTMAAEMCIDLKGDTNLMTAYLISRRLPERWIEEYSIDRSFVDQRNAIEDNINKFISPSKPRDKKITPLNQHDRPIKQLDCEM